MGEVRSFHGLASFYRNFIKNFNVVCNAMIETVRGNKRNSSGHMELIRVLRL